MNSSLPQSVNRPEDAADTVSEDKKTSKAERKRKVKMLFRRIPKLPAAIILLLLICSVFYGWIAPHDPTAQDLSAALKPPFGVKGGSLTHFLGTDSLGRDVLSRVIYGARISVIVGFCSVALSAALGTFLGMIAGFGGGKIDTIIMRFTDIVLSLPHILVSMAIIGAIGPSLQNVIIVLGVTSWVSYTRIIRFEAETIAKSEFVEMAIINGSSRFRTLFVHILPNVLNTVLVLATLDIGKMIIYE